MTATLSCFAQNSGTTMTENALFSEITQLWKHLRISCVCYLLVLFGTARCVYLTDPERDAYRGIKTHLLSHPYAVDKIPPKVNSTESIDIVIGFSPQQILFVDEVEMTVTVAATLYVEWMEPAFAWDPKNTSIFAISVSINDVWRPILMNPLTINTDDMIIQMPPDLRVHHSGKIQTAHKLTITVSCPFDMEWYPFDEQRCSFPIMLSNSEGASLNSKPSQEPEMSIGPGDGDSKGDWTWKSVTPLLTTSVVEMNADVEKNITYVSFEVAMKRRSITFYMTNIIFPIGATAILTLGVFLIPAASGEKISYLISIFISTTVFLSSLSNTMSKGQGTICRFNAFIVAVTVKIIFATAASIFVLHRYQQEQEQEQEQQKEKEGEVTSFSHSETEMYNNRPNTADHQRNNAKNEVRSNPRVAINSVSGSDQTVSRQKLNTFMRTEPPQKTSTDELVAVKSRQTRLPLSGVSKYWRKGYRLSSSELDRMFFIVFGLVTVIVSIIIMHGK